MARGGSHSSGTTGNNNNNNYQQRTTSNSTASAGAGTATGNMQVMPSSSFGRSSFNSLPISSQRQLPTAAASSQQYSRTYSSSSSFDQQQQQQQQQQRRTTGPSSSSTTTAGAAGATTLHDYQSGGGGGNSSSTIVRASGNNGVVWDYTTTDHHDATTGTNRYLNTTSVSRNDGGTNKSTNNNLSAHYNTASATSTTGGGGGTHRWNTPFNATSTNGTSTSTHSNTRTMMDVSQLLSRGYTGRYIGSVLSSYNTITPLSSEEIDRDLLHINAYSTAAARYHQMQYVATNNQQHLLVNNSNTTNAAGLATMANGGAATATTTVESTNGQQQTHEGTGTAVVGTVTPTPDIGGGYHHPNVGIQPPPLQPHGGGASGIVPYQHTAGVDNAHNSAVGSTVGLIQSSSLIPGGQVGVTASTIASMMNFPIRIDPEEEKRSVQLRKRISRTEIIREDLEQQYDALCKHCAITVLNLQSFTKSSAYTIRFLQGHVSQQSSYLAIQRARLQIVRDTMSVIRHREESILHWKQYYAPQYQNRIDTSSNDTNHVGQQPSSEELDRIGSIEDGCPLLAVWNELERVYLDRAMTIAATSMPPTKGNKTPNTKSTTASGVGGDIQQYPTQPNKEGNRTSVNSINNDGTEASNNNADVVMEDVEVANASGGPESAAAAAAGKGSKKVARKNRKSDDNSLNETVLSNDTIEGESNNQNSGAATVPPIKGKKGGNRKNMKQSEQQQQNQNQPAIVEDDGTIIPWPCTVNPATARGVPVLVSSMSTAPEKTIAFACPDLFGSSSFSLLYLDRFLPEMYTSSQSNGANVNTVFTSTSTDKPVPTIVFDDEHPARKEPVDVKSLSDLPSVIMSLNDEVIQLQAQLDLEQEKNRTILIDTCKTRVTSDEWVAMIALVRQETESILHRHNILLESSEAIEANTRLMLIEQQQLQEKLLLELDGQEKMEDDDEEDDDEDDDEEEEDEDGVVPAVEADDEEDDDEEDEDADAEVRQYVTSIVRRDNDDDDEDREDDEDDEEEEDDEDIEEGEIEEGREEDDDEDGDDDDADAEEGEIVEETEISTKKTFSAIANEDDVPNSGSKSGTKSQPSSALARLAAASSAKRLLGSDMPTTPRSTLMSNNVPDNSIDFETVDDEDEDDPVTNSPSSSASEILIEDTNNHDDGEDNDEGVAIAALATFASIASSSQPIIPAVSATTTDAGATAMAVSGLDALHTAAAMEEVAVDNYRIVNNHLVGNMNQSSDNISGVKRSRDDNDEEDEYDVNETTNIDESHEDANPNTHTGKDDDDDDDDNDDDEEEGEIRDDGEAIDDSLNSARNIKRHKI